MIVAGAVVEIGRLEANMLKIVLGCAETVVVESCWDCWDCWDEVEVVMTD